MATQEDELRITVEQTHGGDAMLVQSIPVQEIFKGTTVWEGVVHVFDSPAIPTATGAYAWSSPMQGSTKRPSCEVLHQPPLDSSQAAIIAE